MELVTGSTGYIGSRLLRRLASEQRPVRALARTPERVEALPGVEPMGGDLLSGRGWPALLVPHRLLQRSSWMRAPRGTDFADATRGASVSARGGARGVARSVYREESAAATFVGPLRSRARSKHIRSTPSRDTCPASLFCPRRILVRSVLVRLV